MRRLLLDQQRVYKALAARTDSLTRQRAAALARLRALDRAIASSGESTDVTEIEREVAAIRDVLGREAPTAAPDEPTAIQST